MLERPQYISKLIREVAWGQYFISIALKLEFSPTVLSGLASSLFTFRGQAVSACSHSVLCREAEQHVEKQQN